MGFRALFALVCLGFAALATCKPAVSDDNWHSKFFDIYKQHFRTGMQRFPVGEREHAKEELIKYLKSEIERPAFFEPIADQHVDLLTDEQKSEFVHFVEEFDVTTLPEAQITGSASPHSEGHETHHELTDALTHITHHDWESKYFDIYKQHLKTGLQKFAVGEREHAKEELVKYLKKEGPKPDFFEPIAEKHTNLLNAEQLAEFLEYAEHLDVSTLPEEVITGKSSPHTAGHTQHNDLTEMLNHITGHEWHDKYFEIYKQHFRTGLQRFPVAEREHAKEELVKYMKGEIERPAFVEPVADRHLEILDPVQKAELIYYMDHFHVSELPEHQITGHASPHAEGHTYHADLTSLLSHISGHQWHDKYFALYKEYFTTGIQRFAAEERDDARDKLVHYLKKEGPKPSFLVAIADRYLKLLDPAQRGEFVEFVEHFDLHTLPAERNTKNVSPHGHVERLDLGELLNHISGHEWHDKYFEIYKQHLRTGLLKFPVAEREHAKEQLSKYLKGDAERPEFLELVADQHLHLLDAVQKTEFISYVDHFDVHSLPDTQFTDSGSPHADGHQKHHELTAHFSQISPQDWHEKYFDIFKQHFKTGLQKFPVAEREQARKDVEAYLKGEAPKPAFFEPIADKHVKLLDNGQKNEFIEYIDHFDVSTLPEEQFTGHGSPHGVGHHNHHEITELLSHISGFEWYEKYFDIYKQHFRTGMQKFPVAEREHIREELVKFLKGQIERPEWFEFIALQHVDILDPVQKAEFLEYVEHKDLSTLPEEQYLGHKSPHAIGHHDHYELTDLLSHISGHEWHDKYFAIYKKYFKTGLQKFPAAEREHIKEELIKYLKGEIEKPAYFEPVADQHVDLLDAAEKAEFVEFMEHFDVSTLPEEQFVDAGSPHKSVETLKLADRLAHISGHEWHDKYFEIYKQHLRTGLQKFPVDEREHAKEQLWKFLKGEAEKPDFLEHVAEQHLNVLDPVQLAEFTAFMHNFDVHSLPDDQFTGEGSPHGHGHTAHDKLTEIASHH